MVRGARDTCDSNVTIGTDYIIKLFNLSSASVWIQVTPTLRRGSPPLHSSRLVDTGAIRNNVIKVGFNPN